MLSPLVLLMYRSWRGKIGRSCLRGRRSELLSAGVFLNTRPQWRLELRLLFVELDRELVVELTPQWQRNTHVIVLLTVLFKQHLCQTSLIFTRTLAAHAKHTKHTKHDHPHLFSRACIYSDITNTLHNAASPRPPPPNFNVCTCINIVIFVRACSSLL